MKPRIVLGEGEARVDDTRALPMEAATRLLGPAGLAFILVGGADLALTWIPTAFGTPEWEFGTISQTLNNLPVPTLGVVLLTAWAAATGRRTAVRILGVVAVLLALAIVAIGGLFLLTVPVALHAVKAPLIVLGLKKAIAKAAVQMVAYPVAYLWLAWAGLRRASTLSGKAQTA